MTDTANITQAMHAVADSFDGAMEAHKRLGVVTALTDMVKRLQDMGPDIEAPGPFREGYREAMGDVLTEIRRAVDKTMEGGKP